MCYDLMTKEEARPILLFWAIILLASLTLTTIQSCGKEAKPEPLVVSDAGVTATFYSDSVVAVNNNEFNVSLHFKVKYYEGSDLSIDVAPVDAGEKYTFVRENQYHTDIFLIVSDNNGIEIGLVKGYKVVRRKYHEI